ncbi:hypothetical protein BDZ45DRAFT_669119 [Acephala macrosclerotiorum]|nr:hypothetical protein BDZ45DRAFT_669119 [Acephala macrosclerotiorum]
MSTQRELNRKRAKRPKVKTGCVTCKIRRVKCDETRPECVRCQRFGRGYCDGYENTRVDPPERKVILPKVFSIISEPSPKRDPVIQVFKNQDEFSCFRLYCEEVAPQLSYSNRSVWHQLLLQAGQHQPFIRNAIITIGALNRSMKKIDLRTSPVPTGRKPSMVPDGQEDPNAARIHAFALEHYGQFLQGAKSNIASMTKEQGRRIAMIACLLVVCIENMQYRFQNALSHAQKGLNLLDELRDATPTSRSEDGLSSPVPDLVEDELVQQFNRMEIVVMGMYDARVPSAHRKLKQEGYISIKDMPEKFTDVEQARLYLDLIMRRTFHFMASALADDQASYIRWDDFPPDVESVADPPRPLLDVSTRLRHTPDEISVEQEIYVAENRRWQRAYEHIFRAAQQNLDRVESIRAILLKIHSLAITVRSAGHLSKTELVYDNYMPEFREIISLSRTLLYHPQSEKFFADGRFCFDMGLIYPLMTPAMSCRDRKLRREAIALLGVRQWREAQWSSEPSVDVAEFLMDVEEEGIDTEYIPEWARARLSGVDADLELRTIKLHCIRGVGADAEHREQLRYYGKTGGC